MMSQWKRVVAGLCVISLLAPLSATPVVASAGSQSPEASCSQLIYDSPEFRAFLAVNPQLRTLRTAVQRDAFVARGLKATEDLIANAKAHARTLGLLSEDDDDDQNSEPESVRLAPQGVDMASLALPAGHPSQLANAVIEARLLLAGGKSTAAREALQAEEAEIEAAHRPKDVRLLAILPILSDAYRADTDFELAADANRQFLEIANAHPELARPLAAPIQSADAALAAYYDNQAATLEGLGGDLHISAFKQQSRMLKSQATILHQRSAFYLENAVNIVVGMLPGAAPLSVVDRAKVEPASGPETLHGVIISALSLVAAISGGANAQQSPGMGRAWSYADRKLAAASCFIESGRAFAAWDVSAGMGDFRTFLNQIDAGFAAAFARELADHGGENDYSPIPAAMGQDWGDYAGFAAFGFAGAYGSGDLDRIADAFDAALSDGVVREIARTMGKDKKVRQTFGPYAGTIAVGISRVRAVLTDTLREPSARTIDHTQALQDWLVDNHDTLKNLTKVLLENADNASPDQTARGLANFDSGYPFVVIASNGLVTKAALAMNDIGTAQSAAARSVTRFADLLRKSAPASAKVFDAKAATLTRTNPDSPEYAAAASEFGENVLGGLAQSASKAVYKQDTDEQGADAPLDKSQLDTMSLAVASILQDFFLGRPEMTDAAVAERGNIMASAIDIIDKSETKEFGPDWTKKVFDPSVLAELTPEQQSRVRLFKHLGGLDPLIDRAADVLYVDTLCMKRSGHTHETGVLLDLAENGLKAWGNAPTDIRDSFGGLPSDGVYYKLTDLLLDFSRPDLARQVVGDWTANKRHTGWSDGPPDARWQTRAWRTDRVAWAIDAELAAEKIIAPGGKGGVGDGETVLNAIDAANRGAAGADFARSLRVAQMPQDVQSAYSVWLAAARFNELQRYNDVGAARGRLSLSASIGAISLSTANDRRMGLQREDQSWAAYQAALRAHGLSSDDSPLSLSGLAHSLLPGEVLLTGVSLDDRLWIVTVDSGGRMTVALSPSTLETVRSAADNYRKGLSFTAGGEPRTFDLGAASSLWASIGQPVQASLAGADRIVWAPIRGLDDFPIAALSTTGMGNSNWLGLDKEIMVVPTLSTLVDMRGRSAEAYATPLLAVGDIRAGGFMSDRGSDIDRYLPPTPFAGPTIAALARNVDRATVLVGSAATKDRLQSVRGGSFDVAYFYTHGIEPDVLDHCNLATPQALELFQPREASCSTALLTSEEAAALNIHARMVVLAACATEAAPTADLGPLDGLTRAFLVGGAESVVGAELPVNGEAAAKLSPLLVLAVLNGGEGPSKALRSAMVALSATPGMSDPAFWAQFEVVGEGAARAPRRLTPT